ncbi:MAG TPA: IclR family transcriptional regulator [Candidatus Dormibacteraeota bacterium]|nr:IclR family transcriptional regulator [Candidatus Dormibacteraeota bacterium]
MSNEETRDLSVRSVERAIAILNLLGQGPKTGADVARGLGVHRSTALRLLGTLERHSFVERDSRTQRYRLGRRLPQLASEVTGELDLRSLARPVCEHLAAQSGETATFELLVDDAIVPIEQATASTSVVTVNWIGRRYPVHCTASGKAFLAFGPKALRDRLLARPLERITPRTVTDARELERELDGARTSGVARTHEELEMGLDAVAAPVFGADGQIVAALDVSGPSHRLRGRQDLERLTAGAAAELSARLGYRRKVAAER